MINIKIRTKRNLMLFITLIMMSSALISGLGPFNEKVSADDRELANRIICRFEDGNMLANLHSTDYYYYLFRSKSAITSVSNVNSNLLNKLLTVSGFDFNTPNEAILGRPIRPTSLSDEDTKEANSKAPKVSAFDRFGVSGLKWSSYQGEWKYNQVDACAKQDQISPTSYGAFYEGRLEPQSTHNEVSTSKDPRTIQFDKGLYSSINVAVKDVLTNGLFSIAKLIVTLTIVFVGLAFTDITVLMGLTEGGGAGATAAGIFTDLFNTIFSGFVLFAFLSTAMYLLYQVVFKKQIRLGIGTLIKTIIIFLIAIVMSTNPSFWVGVPNQIATYGQALVLSSMAGVYENGDTDYPTLCSTDVASINENVDFGDFKEAKIKTEFAKVNQNMKSLIGCQMWEQLLFKPWVRGQFGVEYEELANNKLGNINSSWVGEGSVPIGAGKTIDNWALFHLSTQTDAHSQVGESNFPTLVNGVNADWWRIVDAMSNYDESEVTDSLGGQEETFVQQTDSEPTKSWQSWIGNNSSERFGSAVIAILFGIVGSFAPLVFSLSSAVFGLGITLLMMTSPMFLLFGTWGGKGDKIFLGWLSALANMVVKRIAVSILLVLSIAITLSIMDLAYKIGIVKSFILMIVVTAILIKNKNKILDIMAKIDFGGSFDPRTKANKLLQSQNKAAKNVGKVGLATASGAVAGVRTGQGALRGAKLGSQSQLRNIMYQSRTGMNIIRQLDIQVDDERSEGHKCMTCQAKIGHNGKEVAFSDEYGNYYCVDCGEEHGLDTLYEVMVGVEQDNNKNSPIAINQTRTKNASSNRSHLSHRVAKDNMDSRMVDGKYYWNDEQVQQMIKNNILNLREDTLIFNNMKLELGKESRPPSPPEPIHGYIDIALINKAWTDGREDIVESTYKEAWKSWYADNAKHVEGVTQDDVDNFKNEIENYKPDISQAEAEGLMYEYKDNNKSNKKETIKDKNIFIYSNGKLVFNKFDDDERSEVVDNLINQERTRVINHYQEGKVKYTIDDKDED